MARVTAVRALFNYGQCICTVNSVYGITKALNTCWYKRPTRDLWQIVHSRCAQELRCSARGLHVRIGIRNFLSRIVKPARLAANDNDSSIPELNGSSCNTAHRANQTGM
eukprot:13040-Heterococcus_DN1.PRE.1